MRTSSVKEQLASSSLSQWVAFKLWVVHVREKKRCGLVGGWGVFTLLWVWHMWLTLYGFSGLAASKQCPPKVTMGTSTCRIATATAKLHASPLSSPLKQFKHSMFGSTGPSKRHDTRKCFPFHRHYFPWLFCHLCSCPLHVIPFLRTLWRLYLVQFKLCGSIYVLDQLC